jgi:ribosome-binding ATPase YchF (GTP1/OBG family)
MSVSFGAVRISVPINISGTDIAGLDGGVCTCEGLQNEFLSHIRAVNGICDVIRLFENEEVVHVKGRIDPVRDLQITYDERKAKDMEWMHGRTTNWKRK